MPGPSSPPAHTEAGVDRGRKPWEDLDSRTLEIEKGRRTHFRLRRALVGILGVMLVGAGIVIALEAAAIPAYHLTTTSLASEATYVAVVPTATVAYAAILEGNGVHVERSTTGGSSWSPLATVPLGNGPNGTTWGTVNLAVAGSTLLVAVETQNPVVPVAAAVPQTVYFLNATVVAATSTDGGTEWTTATNITHTAEAGGSLSTAVNGAVAGVLFAANVPPDQTAPEVATSADDGGSWTAPVEIDSAVANATFTGWSAQLVSSPSGLLAGVAETGFYGEGTSTISLYALNASTSSTFRLWGNLTETFAPEVVGSSSSGDFVASASGLNELGVAGWPFLPIPGLGVSNPEAVGYGAPPTATVTLESNGTLRVVSAESGWSAVDCWAIWAGSQVAHSTCHIPLVLTSPGSEGSDHYLGGLIASATGGWTLFLVTSCAGGVECGIPSPVGLAVFTYPWSPSPSAAQYDEAAVVVGVSGVVVLMIALLLRSPRIPRPDGPTLAGGSESPSSRGRAGV